MGETLESCFKTWSECLDSREYSQFRKSTEVSATSATGLTSEVLATSATGFGAALVNHFGNNPGTNGLASFAQRESASLLTGDRRLKLYAEIHTVTGHCHVGIANHVDASGKTETTQKMPTRLAEKIRLPGGMDSQLSAKAVNAYSNFMQAKATRVLAGSV